MDIKEELEIKKVKNCGTQCKIIEDTLKKDSRSVSVTEEEEVMVLREELPGKAG